VCFTGVTLHHTSSHYSCTDDEFHFIAAIVKLQSSGLHANSWRQSNQQTPHSLPPPLLHTLNTKLHKMSVATVSVDAATLQSLEMERGHGTSVVTLYVKPTADVGDLVARMKQEVSTAANIKSRL
jgi:hypothetical protein